MENNIRDIFKNTVGDTVTLTPGEYEGPLVIDRPCTLDGKGSALWAEKGAVLTVASEGVTIKDLRIEVTGNEKGNLLGCALKSEDPHVTLVNVEVKGSVIGVENELENINIPSVMGLGEFPPDEENTYAVDIELPCSARLICKTGGVTVSPEHLNAGKNVLCISTGRMADNVILYGVCLLETKVIRRIYILGKTVKGSLVHRDMPVTEMADTDSSSVTNAPDVKAPTAEISPVCREASTGEKVRKGQRAAVSGTLYITYTQSGSDIFTETDCYAFLLGREGKVSGDEDLVFFGAALHPSEGVGLLPDDNREKGVFVKVDRIPEKTDRIVLYFGIYGDDPNAVFSSACNAAICVCNAEKELFRLELRDMTDVKTLAAAEIYRYKGQWRINFIGSCVRQTIAEICRSFGVDVE